MMNPLLTGISEYEKAESVGQEWVELTGLYSKKIGGLTLQIMAGHQVVPHETFFILPCDRLLLVVEFGEEQIHYIEIPKGEWRLRQRFFDKVKQ